LQTTTEAEGPVSICSYIFATLWLTQEHEHLFSLTGMLHIKNSQRSHISLPSHSFPGY